MNHRVKIIIVSLIILLFLGLIVSVALVNTDFNQILNRVALR